MVRIGYGNPSLQQSCLPFGCMHENHLLHSSPKWQQTESNRGTGSMNTAKFVLQVVLAPNNAVTPWSSTTVCSSKQ